MLRFGLKPVLLLGTVLAVATAVAVPKLEVRQARLNKAARVRALPETLIDPCFRVSVVFDLPTAANDGEGLARVIAIEKHRRNSPYRFLQPSFSRLEVNASDRSAIMYVEERAVIPSSELIVFMAEYGDSPERVVVERDEYNKVSGGSIMSLSSDLDLWELCQDTLRRKDRL